MLKFETQNPEFAFLLRQLRSISQYQLGLTDKEAQKFFPTECLIHCSRKTGKIRFVNIENELICTLKPTDGLLALSLQGANRLLKIVPSPKLRIIVQSDVGSFIREGRNVFSKHVTDADELLRPGDEAIIVNEQDTLLGIGTLLLIKREISDFKRGLAVRTRHGMKSS